MQNSTQKLSTKNYSTTTARRPQNKTKKRKSIFSVPEPVEPQRIRRIKNRRNMVKNYRDKIRDIYHQTDYLVSWKEDDLSCFIKPIEQTGSFAFFEKSTRSNYSTLSAAYAGDTYSKYKDITLPYNSTESNNFTENESSNLVSIPTGTFSNSIYNNKQVQSTLNEEQIETYLSDNENEDQIRESFNDEEPPKPTFNNEEYDQYQGDTFEEQNQFKEEEDHFSKVYQKRFNDEQDLIQNQFNDDENEEEFQEEEKRNNKPTQPWIIDDDNAPNEEDVTMEQSPNFTEFSAIQSTNQRGQQNVESKYDISPESEPEEESNKEDLDVDLTVNVIVFEEEEEVNDDEQFLPFQDENVETHFVGVENLPLEDHFAPIFVTFQHYTDQEIPIGRQYVFNVNKNEAPSIFNFSNVNETDLIEALVFLNDDDENPTLVSGARIPVHSVDWNTNAVQVFDLISADDLRSGRNIPSGDAGMIQLVFKTV